jgi:hypothetical protein
MAMNRQGNVQVLSLFVFAALALGLVVAVGSTAGCAGAVVGVDAEYEVDGPPPALQSDVVVASPGPGYVWIGGAYEWDVSRKSYAWRAGRWEQPPHGKRAWEAGHYEMRNGHHYYRPGHWRG